MANDTNRVIVELGTVIKNRNNYSNQARYFKDNVVQYEGGSYIAQPTSSVNDGVLDGKYYLTRAPFTTNPQTPSAGWSVFATGKHNFGSGEDIEDISIATNADFVNPDSTSRAKVPTVGAMLDGMNDGIYDVSSRYPTGGPNNDGVFTLEYILSNANTLIPTAWRKGGMSIKFVQSYDNNYVQYRYMTSSIAVENFTNVANWQGVDDEPTAGSENLVKSLGVVDALGSGEELVGKVTLKRGYIDLSGVLRTASDPETNKRKYADIFLKKGYTVTMVSVLSELLSPFGKHYEPVSNGDSVTKINSNPYTATEDCYLICNAGFSLSSLIITPPQDTLNIYSDNEPTYNSDRLVRSDGVYNKISDIANGGVHINGFDDVIMYFNDSYHDYNSGFVSGSTRLRIVKRVEKGAIIDITATSIASYPVSASIFDTKSAALAFSAHKKSSFYVNGYVQLIDNSYNIQHVTVVSKYNGWLVVGIKKSDDSVFTENDYNTAISSVTLKLSYHGVANNPQGYTAVFTDGSFNIDNNTRKLTYPTFYYVDDFQYYTINSGEFDLNNLTESAKKFVLAVDQTNNSLIVTSVSNSKYYARIIAGLERETNQASSSYITFNGCYKEGLWKIDGVDAFGSIYNLIDEKDSGTFLDTQLFLQKADIYKKVPGSDTAENDANGTRLRIIYYAKAGTYVKIGTTLQSGVFVGCYQTLSEAIVSNRSGQIISPDFGYYPLAEGVISSDGYLSISLTNGDTVITEETKTEMLASLDVLLMCGSLGALYEHIDDRLVYLEESPDLQELFIGTLVQKGYTAEGLSDDTNSKRVSMQSVIAVPYLSVELSVKAPQGYYFGIRSGDRAENLSSHQYWKGNGDVFSLPSNSRYYRIAFGKGGYSSGSFVDTDVPVSEIQGLLDSGELKITYINRHNIIQDNKETEKYVKAMMREFYTTASLNNTLPNIPVFAHTSDIHGDAKRFSQFLDYCDYIGVNAALISGDFAAVNPSNSCQWINDVADKHQTVVLPCTGNHDVRGLYTAKEQNEQVVGYLMNKYEVVVNELEGDYPTYFYKDFAVQKIRLISLNVHELTRSTTDGCNFTQTQAEWFISVLANTPADYGVLVMFHEPEVVTDKDSSHDTFYQPFYTIAIYQTEGISGSPISKIIDAFISKVSANITYTTQSASVTVSADFSNVASGVEFIAYVCGHEHIDWIGTVHNTTNRQLILDVTCGIALYGGDYKYLANISDIPRGGNGVTQDAFNIYGIDRVNKTVRVARVGSNITSEARDRKCMIIPYANS